MNNYIYINLNLIKYFSTILIIHFRNFIWICSCPRQNGFNECLNNSSVEFPNLPKVKDAFPLLIPLMHTYIYTYARHSLSCKFLMTTQQNVPHRTGNDNTVMKYQTMNKIWIQKHFLILEIFLQLCVFFNFWLFMKLTVQYILWSTINYKLWFLWFSEF